MPDPAAAKRAHLLLHDTSQPHAFTAHSPGGGKKKLSERDRQAHGHALLNTIASIRVAELHALWTDDPELLPADRDEAFWWEVWLPARAARQAVVSDFRKFAQLAGCVVSEHHAEFPERTVLLMYASQGQFTQSVMLLNCVAELRRAKDPAEFFDAMGVEEQGLWMNDMLAQAQFAPAGTDAPHVCFLDTGVNRGHPLLAALVG